MERKITGIISVILIIISLAYAEYRFIMHHINPYIGENNTVYLEIFGQMDEYYAENIKE
jgi:hypothetical protein